MRQQHPKQAGTILALTAIMLIGLIIMAAFAVDLGVWYNSATEGQRAADIASLSAVEEYQRAYNAGITGGLTPQQAHDAAVIAATDRANALTAENGYDPLLTTIAFTVDTPPNGSIEITVGVKDEDVETFFAGVVMSDIDIEREATAGINDCRATCSLNIPIVSGFQTVGSSGTGGDGWRPTLADNGYVFNLYHHDSGNMFYCFDRTLATPQPCPGGYPLEPYTNMRTNYTPKLVHSNNRIYFVVQNATDVGLGCWEAELAQKCSGAFVSSAVGKKIENFDYVNGSSYGTRIDGPEISANNQIFTFGENGKVYCHNLDGSVCSGYPKNTALAGAEAIQPKVAGNYETGLDPGINGMQFDMEPNKAGTKVYLSLTPTPRGTSLTCWDMINHQTCSDWTASTPPSTIAGRPFLFLTYDNVSGNHSVTGVCARGGLKAADKGLACFNRNGSSNGTAGLPTAWFNDGGMSQQSATGETTSGHYRTFFPVRHAFAGSYFTCWDWVDQAECTGIVPPSSITQVLTSNWNSYDDYAYIYDGSRCIYGLGHNQTAWTFDVNNGQFPCPADGTAAATIEPCACADGTNLRWTALSLNSTTDISLFKQFTITVDYLNGTNFTTVDLTTSSLDEIDLRPLNDQTPFPAKMRVTVEAVAADGFEDVAFNQANDISVIQLSGVLPTLLN